MGYTLRRTRMILNSTWLRYVSKCILSKCSRCDLDWFRGLSTFSGSIRILLRMGLLTSWNIHRWSKAKGNHCGWDILLFCFMWNNIFPAGVKSMASEHRYVRWFIKSLRQLISGGTPPCRHEVSFTALVSVPVCQQRSFPTSGPIRMSIPPPKKKMW